MNEESTAYWSPCTLKGQVKKERQRSGPGGSRYTHVYLVLSYAKNRVLLAMFNDDVDDCWAKDLENQSLLEVTGTLDYVDEIGEFTINGPGDYSKPTGHADPYWRVISFSQLDPEIYLPGLTDSEPPHLYDNMPVLNMWCPVCRVEPGDPCREGGYRVSHRPEAPHCHQARWDRASVAGASGRGSDALSQLLSSE
jgi:hypothetical protein